MKTRGGKRKQDKVTQQPSVREFTDTRRERQPPEPPQTPPPTANRDGYEGRLDAVEREEVTTPVTNIAGRGVQWSTSQIAAWCEDSDQSVESDNVLMAEFSGEDGDIMTSYKAVKEAYNLILETSDEGDGDDAAIDVEGDVDELKMSIQEQKLINLELRVINLNGLILLLQFETKFPPTWASLPQEDKLRVINLRNKVKHTKLNTTKTISKTKSYTLKQNALNESKNFIPSLLPRKLGDVKQCELDKLLLEEGLEFISRYELELVSILLNPIVNSHYIFLFDVIGADGICRVDWQRFSVINADCRRT